MYIGVAAAAAQEPPAASEDAAQRESTHTHRQGGKFVVVVAGKLSYCSPRNMVKRLHTCEEVLSWGARCQEPNIIVAE